MKIIQESCPAPTAGAAARALVLAFHVANAEGIFVCPCDGKVYASLKKSLLKHLSTVHRKDYTAARELLCGQVVPGPLPTKEQLVAWRRNPWSAADLLIAKEDCISRIVNDFGVHTTRIKVITIIFL